MKKLFLVFIVFASMNCFAQKSRSEYFADFKENLPMYSAGISIALSQLNVDPVITSFISNVLPKIAAEDVQGAILEASNIIYKKTGRKELNPDYTNYLTLKINNILLLISKNDYPAIILTASDIAISTDKYMKTNVAPNSSNFNSNSAAESVIDKNKLQNDMFATPVPQKGWKQTDLTTLHDKLKNKFIEIKQSGKDISFEQCEDLTDCILNELVNKYYLPEFKALSKDNEKKVFDNILADCMHKAGIKTVTNSSNPSNQTGQNSTSIKFTNNSKSKIYTCIAYFDKNENSWVSRGWWNMEANTSYNLNLDNFNISNNTIYIHAYNLTSNWGNDFVFCVDTKAFALKNANNSSCKEKKKFNKFQITAGENTYNFNGK